MKKKICKGLCVLLVCSIGLFTGCQKNGGNTKKIKVLNWGTESEGAVWVELAKSFTEKTGIQIDVETAEWSVYWDKINTLYAAGTPPEVFAMDAPLFMDWYSRGALLSLQDFLDKDTEVLSALYPVTLNAYKTDKGFFGLPRDFQTIALFYNKDMFDKAGVPYPDETWTWEDLSITAKKLIVKDKSGYYTQWGFAPDLWDVELLMSSLVWSYGGTILSPDYKKTTIADNMEPWQLLSKMIIVDKSIPDMDTQAQYGGDLFYAGKAAMTPMGHWSVPQYSSCNFKWDVVPLPQGPAGRATSVNSAGFVMAKNCKNPEAGWEWVKYVLSAEGQSKLAALGFAIPARKDIAQSDVFLNQPVKINHRIFIDALEYAHPKPVFKGYDAWSNAFGNAMAAIYESDDIAAVMKTAVSDADASLVKQ